MLKALIAALTMGALAPAPSVSGPCGSSDLDRRGCCSHHNGVCGCNSATGMLRCCDNTDSPSCDCNRPD